jgi:hypothetical protein
VSAALAARAAAESTKAQMKQAQALRRDMAAAGGSAAGGGGVAVHTDAELKQFTVNPLPRKNSKGKVTEVRELVGQASSVMADGMEDEVAASAEDSIQRTQMFLRQRLAKATGGAGADAAKQQSAADSAAATAAQLAQQALERQQQQGAVYLYGNGSDGVTLSTPALQPAGPPLDPSSAYFSAGDEESSGQSYSHSMGGLRSSGIAGVSADSTGVGSVTLPKIRK